MRLSHDSVVRDYMDISGMGLMLLLVSNKAIAFVDQPYPPFGLYLVHGLVILFGCDRRLLFSSLRITRCPIT